MGLIRDKPINKIFSFLFGETVESGWMPHNLLTTALLLFVMVLKVQVQNLVKFFFSSMLIKPLWFPGEKRDLNFYFLTT